MKIIFLFLFMVIFGEGSWCYASAAGDTSKIIAKKFVGNVSTSFSNSENWKGSTFNSLSAALDIDFNRSKTTDKSNYLFVVRSELGFTKFIDSVWDKHADKLFCSYIWKRKKKKVDHSASFSLTTQMLNSYLNSIDPLTGVASSEWSGTFFNPAILDCSYGMAVSFWKNSMWNLSIATVRLKTEPKTQNKGELSGNKVGTINRGWLLLDYGVSTQLITSHNLSRNINMNTTAKFFMKGWNRESVELDVNHKFNYVVWKWIQVRADFKIVYDPVVSLKMQYHNELLFGVFYDSDKKPD